jgi:hypothetical protein
MINMKNITRQNIIFIAVILVLIIYNFVQALEKNNLKKAYRGQIENLKEESKAEIFKQLYIIDSLEFNIVGYYRVIEVFEQKIDSLQKLKSKIIYIHDDKKKKIKSFDASRLEKYWRDEL